MKTRLRKDRDIYFFDLEGNLDMGGRGSAPIFLLQ